MADAAAPARRRKTPAPESPGAASARLSAPVQAMRRLGLVRDIDLALHLPLRYEDETRLQPIGTLRDGDVAQVEGVVTDCRVEHAQPPPAAGAAGRRVGRAAAALPALLPVHTRSRWPRAQRLRVRGEARAGFFGREMVHPGVKVVAEGAPLPEALTPVYPTSAQLPQAYLRKAVVSALARAPLTELLPPQMACRPACPACARRCSRCTTRRRARRWPRWKTAATRPGSG
jgi:ATP-dependent DNA helicase RecG